MTTPYTVGLVFDPQFGEDLEALASRMHVWVIDSPANREVAERIWATGARGSIERGVTTFGEGAPGADREAQCLGMLESVDLHHGEYSHDPPYSVLEVIGVKASPVLRKGLGEFGFQEFTDTPEGFRASK
jgi:hypothetical protein